MKIKPNSRQLLALAAVKLLVLGAAFALPAAGPGFIPAAYAAATGAPAVENASKGQGLARE